MIISDKNNVCPLFWLFMLMEYETKHFLDGKTKVILAITQKLSFCLINPHTLNEKYCKFYDKEIIMFWHFLCQIAYRHSNVWSVKIMETLWLINIQFLIVRNLVTAVCLTFLVMYARKYKQTNNKTDSRKLAHKLLNCSC